MPSESEEIRVTSVEPEDFELGDEPIEVERRPRAGAVLSIRLSGEEVDRLQQLAKARGISLSRMGREAIIAFIEAGGPRLEAGISWTVGAPFANAGSQGSPTIVELVMISKGGPVPFTHGGVIQGRASQGGALAH
jgi:predicted transcriptional regulator